MQEKNNEFLIPGELYLKILKRNKPILLLELLESQTKMPIEKLRNKYRKLWILSNVSKKGRLHDISLFNNENDHRYPSIGKGIFVYNFIFFTHN